MISAPRRRSASNLREDGQERVRLRGAQQAGQPATAGSRWTLQTVGIGVAAVCLIAAALLVAGPLRGSGGSGSGGSTSAAEGPACFPLTDSERVKLLARANTAARRNITSASADAQALFNLGLLTAWGFERKGAVENFMAALRADPRCAMCRWGLAYVAGPYPNVVPGLDNAQYPVFSPAAARDAEEHAMAAARLAAAALAEGHAGRELLALEAQLTELTAKRFTGAAAAVRSGDDAWFSLERAYAEALAGLAEAHKQDADIFVLAAEAFMNLSPWDYYSPAGELRPTAVRAEALLQRALSLNPSHPLALHLHIHVAEAGAPTLAGAGNDHARWAGRAAASADALLKADPRMGHLLHMPSHIYLRIGEYQLAVASNVRAYNLDVSQATQCVVPYLPEHNVNMLIYAASMAGMLHTAEAYSRGIRSLRQRVADTWMSAGSEWQSLPLLLVRYGEWKKVLELDPPTPDSRGPTAFAGRQYAQVVWHYARTMAMSARAQAYSARAYTIQDQTAFKLAAKGASARLDDALREMQRLQAAIASVPTEPMTRPGQPPGIYASAYQISARIYGALAAARIALVSNATAKAVGELEEAFDLERTLGYMEPPRVHQPVAQCLGLVLTADSQYQRATRVYNQDLEEHPNNGWSLLGLAHVLNANQDRDIDALQRFRKAWQHAEVEIESSCPALSRAYLI